MPRLSPLGQEMLERHPGLVIVPTSGGGSRELRQRLSPDAERHLREHGDKVTLINHGSDLDPAEPVIDEGDDGHLWIPVPREGSRIVIPVMAGFGPVKER